MFAANDERSKLTWRNNFSSARADKVYTFSAPTDEAFRPHRITIDELRATAMPAISGMPYTDVSKAKASMGVTFISNWFANWLDSEKMGTYGWAVNELMKGTELLPDWPLTLFTDSKYGGWGFNLDQGDNYNRYVCSDTNNCTFEYVKPEEANLLDRDPTATDQGRTILKTKPFFNKSNPANSALFASGQVSTLTTDMREKLLANEIPALTFSVGHRGVGGFDNNNIDIRATYLPVGKPWVRPNKEWRHSDFINVAYPYLYLMYDDFKNKSQTNTGGY